MTFGIIKNVFRNCTNFVFNQQNNEVFYPSDCLEVQTGTMVDKHSFYTNKGPLAQVANLLVNLTINVSQKIEEAIKGLEKEFNNKIEKLEEAITKVHKKVRSLEKGTSDATGKTLVTLTKEITDSEKGNLSLFNPIRDNLFNSLNCCDNILKIKQTIFDCTRNDYKKTWQFFHGKILLIKVKKRNFDLQNRKDYRRWIHNKKGHKYQNKKNYLRKDKIIIKEVSEDFKQIEDLYQGHLQVYTMKIVLQNSSDSGITTSSVSSSDTE